MYEHSVVNTCCSKRICDGCNLAAQKRGMKDCAFCRSPFAKNDGDELSRVQARASKDDPVAIFNLGKLHYHGGLGLRRDARRAAELYAKAAELGSVDALHLLGGCHDDGVGVKQDMPKSIQLYERAAMRGHPESRYNLGTIEGKGGDYRRATRHLSISAGMGDDDSLGTIRRMFSAGVATREEYARALGGYRDAVEETRSRERDDARSFQESRGVMG